MSTDTSDAGVSAPATSSSTVESRDEAQPITEAPSQPSSLMQGPVSGVFAIVKPTHHTSMKLLDALKPLFASSSVFQVPAEDGESARGGRQGKWGKRKRGGRSIGPSAPKIGQGGTLDPLADGVLVIGIGRGTKQLNTYLDCTKEYRTVALLGASTLSYDSDDPILLRRPHAHLHADDIERVLPHFRGKGTQLPPLYSAVKIDGKRLFDYAREGLDLPRPIERRTVDVSNLELTQWQAAGEHGYPPATRECSQEERTLALRARKLAGLDESRSAEALVQEGEQRTEESGQTGPEEAIDATTKEPVATPNYSQDTPKAEISESGTAPQETVESVADDRDIAPAAFTLDMTVSSGTYVRTIVHDVGVRAGSAAYVVKLTRTRQGKWVTPDYVPRSTDATVETKEAIEWDVFARALERLKATGANEEEPHMKRQALEDRAVADASETSTDALVNGPDEWERIVLERIDRC